MSETNELKNREAGKAGVPHHKVSCECVMCERLRKQAELAAAKRERLAEIPTTPKKLQTSMKRRQFVKELCDPSSPGFGDPKEAAIEAGYSPRAGEELLKDENVRKMLLEEMNKQGLTPDAIVAKLKEGLSAFETKLATRDGQFTDERAIPDFHARYKFLELAVRVHGGFAKKEEEPAAQLIINTGRVEFVAGHGTSCLCLTCTKAAAERVKRIVDEEEAKHRAAGHTLDTYMARKKGLEDDDTDKEQ